MKVIGSVAVTIPDTGYIYVCSHGDEPTFIALSLKEAMAFGAKRPGTNFIDIFPAGGGHAYAVIKKAPDTLDDTYTTDF